MSVMKMRLNRKLFRFGQYSLALLVPKSWLREQGIEPGHSVELEYQRSKQQIVLHLNSNPADPKPAPKPVAKISSSTQMATSDSDWEPIPQL